MRLQKEQDRCVSIRPEILTLCTNNVDIHNRLDLSHKIFLLLMKGDLHWAPIGNDPKRVCGVNLLVLHGSCRTSLTFVFSRS